MPLYNPNEQAQAEILQSVHERRTQHSRALFGEVLHGRQVIQGPNPLAEWEAQLRQAQVELARRALEGAK